MRKKKIRGKKKKMKGAVVKESLPIQQEVHLPQSQPVDIDFSLKSRGRLKWYTVNGKCRFLMTIFFCLLFSFTYAQMITGKVIRVSDGDTFTMLIDNNKQQRVRLYGIDAPEKTGSQPFWRQSREQLAELIAGKIVRVKVQNYDRYKRAVGIVTTDSCKDVNLYMLQTGLAWHYAYYDKTPSYKLAAERAKKAKRGLWSQHNPINPYEWRKSH